MLRVGGRLQLFNLLAADLHLAAQALNPVESGLHVFDFSQLFLNLLRAVRTTPSRSCAALITTFSRSSSSLRASPSSLPGREFSASRSVIERLPEATKPSLLCFFIQLRRVCCDMLSRRLTSATVGPLLITRQPASCLNSCV